MIKRILLFIVQFCAFLALLDLGGNWDVVRFAQQIRAMQNHTTAFNPISTIKMQISASHILIANGLIFALVLLVIILLVEALRRRLRRSGGVTGLAFLAAVVVAFLLKMGIVPTGL